MGQTGEPWIPAALPQRSAIRKQDDRFSPFAWFHCDSHWTAQLFKHSTQLQPSEIKLTQQLRHWSRTILSSDTHIELVFSYEVSRPIQNTFSSLHNILRFRKQTCSYSNFYHQTKSTKPFQWQITNLISFHFCMYLSFKFNEDMVTKPWIGKAPALLDHRFDPDCAMHNRSLSSSMLSNLLASVLYVTLHVSTYSTTVVVYPEKNLPWQPGGLPSH